MLSGCLCDGEHGLLRSDAGNVIDMPSLEALERSRIGIGEEGPWHDIFLHRFVTGKLARAESSARPVVAHSSMRSR